MTDLTRATASSLLERTRDLATMSEDELKRLAAEAARDRNVEALWALTEAHLTLHGSAGSRVSRHTLAAYRRGLKDLLIAWQGENLLRPRKNAGVLWVRELEGRLKPASVGVKLAAAKTFYAALRGSVNLIQVRQAARVFGSPECPKGYRFPKAVISYAVYLYHRFLLSYRDVQELLFKRGVNVSHETIRAWCAKFGPDIAEALRHRKPKRGRSWHLNEMRVVVGGDTRWLWRAVNEHGEVLDVVLQEQCDTGAAKRFFKRLIDDHELPERIVTDGLRSYGAALRELPELDTSEHIIVSAEKRQNNLIEQSHRPTRDQER